VTTSTTTASSQSTPDTDREVLLDLWRLMVTIREFETRVSALAQSDEVDGYLHTYTGEEAVACGVIPLLRDDDWLTSTYRNHGHAIARGVPLEAITGELFGKSTGVCGGKGGSMHVADQTRGMLGAMGIVAGGLPVATGAAFAARYLGQDRVAVSFFGDGAVHQGAWHEALEFASLFRCPVVFLCENNLYAETTAVDYHLLSGSVSAMTGPYRIPAVQVDGMDVLAVRAAAADAIAHARSGAGPVLVEAMTYRYGGQYEGDTQTYKPPSEVEHWRARDPLLVAERLLTERDIATAEKLADVRRDAAVAVHAAFDAARTAPWPDLSTVTADVYTR
jgi:pyruvate dehydrogenase E1 component alpha subunit